MKISWLIEKYVNVVWAYPMQPSSIARFVILLPMMGCDENVQQCLADSWALRNAIRATTASIHDQPLTSEEMVALEECMQTFPLINKEDGISAEELEQGSLWQARCVGHNDQLLSGLIELNFKWSSVKDVHALKDALYQSRIFIEGYPELYPSLGVFIEAAQASCAKVKNLHNLL